MSRARVLAVIVGTIVAVSAANVQGQVQVNSGGFGRDANRQVGTGGRNPTAGGYSTLGNQILSGNVGAGKSFKGSSIGSYQGFQGSMGSTSLSKFKRDSYGISNNAGHLGVPQPFYDPSGTILGVRGITSGRTIPGGSAPRSVNLSPPPNTGPAVSQGSTGVVSGYAALSPADMRSDLRAGAEGQLVNPGVVETGSNLFGMRRMGPGPSMTAGSAVYTANTSSGMWSAESAEQAGFRGEPSMSFQALPPWARGGVGVEAGTDQERSLPRSIDEERIEKNLQTARDLIDQASGGADMPSIVDVYEQMSTDDASAGQLESGPGTEGVSAIIPSAKEDRETSLRSTAEKMLVYNSFVGSQSSSFNDLMGQAESLLKSGQYYYAARTYRRASELRPENPLAYLGQCYSLMGAGEVVSAAGNLSKALELFPEQVRRKIDLKGFFQSAEEFQRITEKLEARANLRTRSVHLRLLLGYIYHYEGKSEAAVQFLKEAAELSKEDDSISAELRVSISKFAQTVAKGSEAQTGEIR